MPQHYAVDTHIDVPVRMRDGVALSTDLYLPHASGEFPCILIRTPYSNNGNQLIAKARAIANNGYVCAIQDCRGRWDSGGEFHGMAGEGEDGYDTQQWIAQQPWSDGKIGMMGGSYLGWVQWTSAVLGNAALKCIAPAVIGSDFYFNVRTGGALHLGLCLTWSFGTDGRTTQDRTNENWTEAFNKLPLSTAAERLGRDIPHLRDWVEHETHDEYWEQRDVSDAVSALQIPALVMSGWYDPFLQHTLTDFQSLRADSSSGAARESRLVIGPWVHPLSNSPRVGEIDFGFNSMLDLDTLHLEWFDRWLKGKKDQANNTAPVRLFIMGANEWRDEQKWPLARTEYQKWYLHSDGSSNTVLGDGMLSTEPPDEEATDRFLYDPRFPVQTIGGANCCSPEITPWGPYDQRPAEMRGDVLCYTSAPLDDDLEVTGPIRAILYAATDGTDTDWTVKLVDVWPSGYAMLLTDGILRARFRDGYVDPQLLEPNRIYQYEIAIGATGNLFRKGHSIRVEISSSNFPRYDRNLNTNNQDQVRTAEQIVHHDGAHPSHLLLPVIPA